jgi:hypothetical protein
MAGDPLLTTQTTAGAVSPDGDGMYHQQRQNQPDGGVPSGPAAGASASAAPAASDPFALPMRQYFQQPGGQV